MNPEQALRAEIVQWARSLFERGLTGGTSGNISARLPDGALIVTPTGSCFGFLNPGQLSLIDPAGRHAGGDKPTKELPLHRAFYDTRPGANAVVHLHSTFATALSILADTDPDDAIPAVTPYVVMRLGRIPMVAYHPPGDEALGQAVARVAENGGRKGGAVGVLLANHGPVVAAPTLLAAVSAMEELEETARLVFLTRGMPVRRLTRDEVARLA